MSESLDISDSKVGISLVNSSVIPESPCIKIIDIVDVANDKELLLANTDLLPILQWVAPTSDTLKFLFCPRKNSFIQIWDVHACQLVSTIDMGYNCISIPRGWAVTNDGKTFLCAPGDTIMSSVELWDIHSSTFIRKLEMGIFYPHLCISPDSRRLAVADSDHHRVHIYDLQTGIIRSSSHAPATPRYPIIVGWSPNSDRVMTYESLGNHTSGVASAIVWQVTDSAVEPVTEPIQLNCAHLLYPRHIMFSGDRIIYLYHGELLIGHLENGHFQVRVQERREDLLGPCALSPDGQMFACITRDHNCMIVDATSGSIIGGPLGNGGNYIHSLCFASNGDELVVLCYYASIRVWDVKAALEQYRVAHSQKDANASSAPNEAAASTSTPTASLFSGTHREPDLIRLIRPF
ncbi:Quino protein amine dehydrogenase [Hygrophoropsis aurantiaca]|uniref:Quino protein amine dehydrogenase n=1 Tax=Hygrophoropsis aurantiaca TaxID=72124 RepID=A0ACB8AB24_9AGAM|nr:Quino protein amine dehydrogenase [Hygrophoropsis aurantiaca]